ncbi:MAG TPA: hypothetical protein VJJ80_01135 [Patescibacteria group bacterium]|nr:hypothetical protein [Patescibacteria group bacterium]
MFKPVRNQSINDLDALNYEDWKGKTKAEKREVKHRKKMPVEGAGLFEVWKMKAEMAEKNKAKNKPKK